jgi:hypothetical protein
LTETEEKPTLTTRENWMRFRRWVFTLGQRQETSVLTGKTSSFQPQMEHLRAGLRLNSRVPVAVEWTEDGKTHCAEGFTMDVSPKGCMAVVPQGFAVGQRLRLVNKVTGLTADAVLIWRGHEGRTGWELGLELREPPAEFWGVEF